MPDKQHYSLRGLDITYGLFIFASLAGALVFSSDENGIALGTTVGVAGFLALLAGTARALFRWRHRPLLLVAVSFLLIAVTTIVIGLWTDDAAAKHTHVPRAVDISYAALCTICAAVIVLMPVWWFVTGRKRYE